jgi:hypothetical protein
MICCPYCGERFELIVDPSVTEQSYIEDCYVCCRPIVIAVTVFGEDIMIDARVEDEA